MKTAINALNQRKIAKIENNELLNKVHCWKTVNAQTYNVYIPWFEIHN